MREGQEVRGEVTEVWEGANLVGHYAQKLQYVPWLISGAADRGICSAFGGDAYSPPPLRMRLVGRPDHMCNEEGELSLARCLSLIFVKLASTHLLLEWRPAYRDASSQTQLRL